jgi:hypothetical protein
MSSNAVGRLITRTITTMQHFATLHHTSPNHTSQHLSTLHLLSFTLHTLSFGLTHVHFLPFYFTSHHLARHSTALISKLISKNNDPLHCPKEPLTISLHFTSLVSYFSLTLSTLHFTLLYYSYLQLTSLHFTFLHFLLSIPFTSPHWFPLS